MTATNITFLCVPTQRVSRTNIIIYGLSIVNFKQLPRKCNVFKANVISNMSYFKTVQLETPKTIQNCKPRGFYFEKQN